MIIVDSLLVGGIRWVLGKVVDAVDAELSDDSALREELLAAQMRLELGEIEEEDFVRIEAQVLAGLRVIRARQATRAGGAEGQSEDGEAAAAEFGGVGRFTVASVEADLGEDREGAR